MNGTPPAAVICSVPPLTGIAAPLTVASKTAPPPPIDTVRRATGSMSGKVIDDAELQNLAHYRQVATRLMESHTISTTGRAVATVEDVAIMFMLLRFFHGNMNADGTLPVARVEGLWKALSGAGDVVRAWEAKRFTAIRNWLSSLGLIDWQDHSYQIGRPGKRGRKPKPIETMLRMYLLQVWFSLSDEGVEDAVYDSYAMRRFMGLDFAVEQVPDATTLLHFRHLLEEHHLGEKLLAAQNEVFAQQGWVMRGGRAAGWKGTGALPVADAAAYTSKLGARPGRPPSRSSNRRTTLLPSSRGLGRGPLKAKTRVRIP